MGKVSYAPGIEYVSGSLAKAKKMDGHRHGEYLIATHRTAPTQNPNCTRLYVRKGEVYDRPASMTELAIAARDRFSAVAAAVKARAKNLTTLASDQQAFKAQKDLVNGKKTMRAYLWLVCGAEYDQQHR